MYANTLLQENADNPEFKPYFRMLLSFKEEDLDLSQLTEIYQTFKERFFKNYDKDEYNLFSVIHWDDNKPHIHVGVISNSIINQKALRVMRGYHDVPRVDAIAETINYEYSLASAKESISLFQLTPSQKIRDWKVKKGRPYYEVPDDEIHLFIKQSVKKSNNFDEFTAILKKRFPNLTITAKEFETQAQGKMKEEILDLKIDSQNDQPYRYKSFLFNKEWFNKNIKTLKNEDDLSSFRTSIKRESYDHYQKQFDRMSENHRAELEERNIHEGLLEHKLMTKQISLGDKDVLSNMDLTNITTKNIYDLKQHNLQTKTGKQKFADQLSFITQRLNSVEELEMILDLIDFEYKSSGTGVDKNKYVIITPKDSFIPITVRNDHLFKIANQSSDDLLPQFQTVSQPLEELISPYSTSKREELSIIKKKILEFSLGNISTKEELFAEFGKANIEIIKEGEDYKKGKYLTVKYKNKKFNLFSQMLYNIYQEQFETLPTTKPQPNDLLSSVTKEVSTGELKPESLNEFALKNEDYIDCQIEAFSNEESKNFFPDSQTRDRNLPYLYKKIGDRRILVEKCLDIEKFIIDLCNEANDSKTTKIKLNGDYDFQDNIIKRFKELSESPNFSNLFKNLIISSSIYMNDFKIEDSKIKPIKQKRTKPKAQERQIKTSDKPILSKKDTAQQLKSIKDEIETLKEINKLIVNIDTNSLNDKESITRLLTAVSMANDLFFWEQIVENVNLNYKVVKNKKGETVQFWNKASEKDRFTIPLIDLPVLLNLNIPHQNTSHLIDQNKNLFIAQTKEAAYDILLSKEHILSRAYNKNFAKSPLLGYKIGILNATRKTKEVIYRQKESIIVDRGDEIEIIKSNNIDKAIEDILTIARERDLDYSKISGDNNFKNTIAGKETIQKTELVKQLT